MQEPTPSDDAPVPLSDDEDLVEYVSLGGLLPIIPPDETSGVEGVREMAEEEVAQFHQDAELLRALASAVPYSRAAAAFLAIEEVVREVAAFGSRPLSRRGQQRVLRAFAVFSRAMEALPKDLTQALRERLGDGEAAECLAAAQDELKDYPAYRLAVMLDAVPADALVAVVQAHAVELVLPREALARWSAAGSFASPGDVLLLDTASEALVFSQRMASRWLLEHADQANDASRRIARLGGEVICGRPSVITMKLLIREGEPPVPVNVTPEELPLEEMQSVQATLRRAKRVLEEDNYEPALKGGQGLYAEQIANAVGGMSGVDYHGDSDAGEANVGPGPDDKDSVLDPTRRPLDMRSLVLHLGLGARRLEMAWSRALEDDDVAAIVAEWASLVTATTASFEHADRELADEQRMAELPVTAESAARVTLDAGSSEAATQARLAQATSLAAIVKMLPALRVPTQRHVDPESGRPLEWFSSGAFAAVNDQLELLAFVCGLWPDTAEWIDSFARAVRAARRADAEAVVLHVARAVHARGPTALEGADPSVAKVLGLTADAARRLAQGDRLDFAALALLAEAALPAATNILGPTLPRRSG